MNLFFTDQRYCSRQGRRKVIPIRGNNLYNRGNNLCTDIKGTVGWTVNGLVWQENEAFEGVEKEKHVRLAQGRQV